jgi:hypothetical protein
LGRWILASRTATDTLSASPADTHVVPGSNIPIPTFSNIEEGIATYRAVPSGRWDVVDNPTHNNQRKTTPIHSHISDAASVNGASKSMLIDFQWTFRS